jgi:Ca2+:H+ antiporter
MTLKTPADRQLQCRATHFVRTPEVSPDQCAQAVAFGNDALQLAPYDWSKLPAWRLQSRPTIFQKRHLADYNTVPLLAVASLVIPSAAHLMASTSTDGMRAQSRGISVVIMASYALWILFQLKTNQEMFKEPSPKTPKRASRNSNDRAVGKGVAAIGAGAAAASGGWVNARMLVKKVPSDNDEEVEEEQGEEEEGFETPSLSLIGATTALVVSVVLVAFNTEFTTNSIQALLQRRNVPQTFLSLIILPLLSTDFLAVGVAMKDKMDMSISLTLERCMQTSLMVIPLTVLLAWIMGIDEMDLKFDGFPITALFASIVIVTYVVQEGKSNW